MIIIIGQNVEKENRTIKLWANEIIDLRIDRAVFIENASNKKIGYTVADYNKPLQEYMRMLYMKYGFDEVMFVSIGDYASRFLHEVKVPHFQLPNPFDYVWGQNNKLKECKEYLYGH